MFCEKDVGKIDWKKPVSGFLFLIRLQASACNFIKKETQALVFPCEICETSIRTPGLTEHPRLAASDRN